MTATPTAPTEHVHISQALREITRITALTDSLQSPALSAAWRNILAWSAESALRGVLPPLESEQIGQSLPSA